MAAVLGAGAGRAAPRLELQYFHDVKDSRFVILDLAFFSPRQGVAVGYLSENGRTRPYSVATSNGGETWTPVPIREPGTSLFVLNETVGWMVGEQGLWKTVEAGRSWQRLTKEKKMLRVWFVDESRGWAVGRQKSVWETKDGGRRWTVLPVAAEPNTSPEYTNYTWIEFFGRLRGAISGHSEPPRRSVSPLPDWMDPERAPREWPGSAIVIQTLDGGNTWKPITTSMFGRITRLRLRGQGPGLALVQFRHSFEWPSEVYLIDLAANSTERVFREKDRSITDVLFTADGRAWLGGFEPVGTMSETPVPGRVVLLHSADLKKWEGVAVDYRAVAKRVTLAASGNELWAATDTGMILKLARE